MAEKTAVQPFEPVLGTLLLDRDAWRKALDELGLAAMAAVTTVSTLEIWAC